MSVRLLLVFALATLVAGCITVGQEFEVQRVSQLEIGVTRQADVRELLGEPWRTGIEDGLTTWTYGDFRYSVFSEAKTRDLVVRYDAEGVVRSYAFNSTYAEDRSLGK